MFDAVLHLAPLKTSALRGIVATSGHGVFSVRGRPQKDARPGLLFVDVGLAHFYFDRHSLW